MIDSKEVLARHRAAQEFSVEVGAATFHMRLPTAFEERRIAMGLQDAGDAAAARWLHDLTVVALITWTGVTVDDLLGDGDTAELPHSTEVAQALIDARIDILDALTAKLAQVREARQARTGADAKNSESVSSTN